jgi:hypothetical protein
MFSEVKNINWHTAYLAGNVAGQPVQAFVQSLTRCSTSALNVPIKTVHSDIYYQAEVQHYGYITL